MVINLENRSSISYSGSISTIGILILNLRSRSLIYSDELYIFLPTICKELSLLINPLSILSTSLFSIISSSTSNSSPSSTDSSSSSTDSSSSSTDSSSSTNSSSSSTDTSSSSTDTSSSSTDSSSSIATSSSSTDSSSSIATSSSSTDSSMIDNSSRLSMSLTVLLFSSPKTNISSLFTLFPKLKFKGWFIVNWKELVILLGTFTIFLPVITILFLCFK